MSSTDWSGMHCVPASVMKIWWQIICFLTERLHWLQIPTKCFCPPGRKTFALLQWSFSNFNPPFDLVCIIIYLYYNFSGSIKACCKIHLLYHLLGKCKETGTNERNESKCFTVTMLFSEGEKWRSFLRLTYPSLFKTKLNLNW